MKTKLILTILSIMLVGCGEPITDGMVKAVGETCKEHGMVLYVNGDSNYVECRKVVG